MTRKREREDEHDSIQERFIETRHEDYHRGIRWTRGRRAPRRALPAAGRDALIAGIAETLLIERALPELLDPDAHAVTCVISRIGATETAQGVRVAARALARDAWLDDFALHDPRRAARPEDPPAISSRPDGPPPRLTSDALIGVRDVALTLRGLFVRAALAGDHGTWMVRAAAAEPDVVRVEIRSGSGASARDVLRAHLAARRQLDRALEVGGALPANPDVLLPVTRVITYRPPLRHGAGFGVEIEDFATGWVDRTSVPDLEEAVRRCWHLAWSRQTP